MRWVEVDRAKHSMMQICLHYYLFPICFLLIKMIQYMQIQENIYFRLKIHTTTITRISKVLAVLIHLMEIYGLWLWLLRYWHRIAKKKSEIVWTVWSNIRLTISIMNLSVCITQGVILELGLPGPILFLGRWLSRYLRNILTLLNDHIWPCICGKYWYHGREDDWLIYFLRRSLRFLFYYWTIRYAARSLGLKGCFYFPSYYFDMLSSILFRIFKALF